MLYTDPELRHVFIPTAQRPTKTVRHVSLYEVCDAVFVVSRGEITPGAAVSGPPRMTLTERVSFGRGNSALYGFH